MERAMSSRLYICWSWLIVTYLRPNQSINCCCIVTPHVMNSLTFVLSIIIMHQSRLLIKFLLTKRISNWSQFKSLRESQEIPNFWIPNSFSWADLSSMCNQELLVQIYQFLKIPIKIESNSIEIQTLQLPWFLIQILSWILKSSNKEIRSLSQELHIHILFEIFKEQEGPLLIKSIQVIWIFFE
jgi:hypothetical protein